MDADTVRGRQVWQAENVAPFSTLRAQNPSRVVYPDVGSGRLRTAARYPSGSPCADGDPCMSARSPPNPPGSVPSVD
jgi:hypothetical protein